MHRFNRRSLVVLLFAIGLSGTSISGRAQVQPADPNVATPKSDPVAPKSEPVAPKKKPKPDKESKGHSMPFHGKIEAVDKVGKTLTVKGKEKEWIFQITSHTKLSKDGKPATLVDAVVGENVGGFGKETAVGKFEASSIRFGANPPGHPKPKKPKKEPTPEPKPE